MGSFVGNYSACVGIGKRSRIDTTIDQQGDLSKAPIFIGIAGTEECIVIFRYNFFSSLSIDDCTVRYPSDDFNKVFRRWFVALYMELALERLNSASHSNLP